MLQWKNIKYYISWVCVCSLRYSACNAHAPYCHMWTDGLYSIFPHYLTNGPIFGKKVIDHKMCGLISSTTFVWNISHYRWIQQDTMISALKVPVILVRFWRNLCFLEKFSKKKLKCKISLKFVDCEPSSSMWTHGQMERQTDRHTKANNRFSKFCERT